MANLGRLAIAMLGILAYQNRDKISDAIRGAGRGTDPNNPQGGLLDQLSKGVSGTALGDVLDRFRKAGAGAKVDSWVRQGPNEPIRGSGGRIRNRRRDAFFALTTDRVIARRTHCADHPSLAGSSR